MSQISAACFGDLNARIKISVVQVQVVSFSHWYKKFQWSSSRNWRKQGYLNVDAFLYTCLCERHMVDECFIGFIDQCDIAIIPDPLSITLAFLSFDVVKWIILFFMIAASNII